jgi:hypothetical protein
MTRACFYKKSLEWRTSGKKWKLALEDCGVVEKSGKVLQTGTPFRRWMWPEKRSGKQKPARRERISPGGFAQAELSEGFRSCLS